MCGVGYVFPVEGEEAVYFELFLVEGIDGSDFAVGCIDHSGCSLAQVVALGAEVIVAHHLSLLLSEEVVIAMEEVAHVVALLWSEGHIVGIFGDAHPFAFEVSETEFVISFGVAEFVGGDFTDALVVAHFVALDVFDRHGDIGRLESDFGGGGKAGIVLGLLPTVKGMQKAKEVSELVRKGRRRRGNFLLEHDHIIVRGRVIAEGLLAGIVADAVDDEDVNAVSGLVGFELHDRGTITLARIVEGEVVFHIEANALTHARQVKHHALLAEAFIELADGIQHVVVAQICSSPIGSGYGMKYDGDIVRLAHLHRRLFKPIDLLVKHVLLFGGDAANTAHLGKYGVSMDDR